MSSSLLSKNGFALDQTKCGLYYYYLYYLHENYCTGGVGDYLMISNAVGTAEIP